MKVGYFVNYVSLLFVALLAPPFKSVSGGRIVEYIFGKVDKYGLYVEDCVEDYYNDYNGDRSVSREEVRAQGERALACLANIAEIDLDRVMPAIPFVKNIVYKSLYEAFGSQEDIDEICSYRKVLMHFQTRRELEEENFVTVSSKQSHTHHRALETAATPAYPSGIPRYVTWANSNLGPYIFDDNLDVRMDPGRVANQIQNNLARLRAVRIGLVTPKNAFETGCRVAGWVELIFDPGDACRIISESIDLGSQIVEQAIQRTRNEQTFADTHNELIDSAEFRAIRENAQELVRSI